MKKALVGILATTMFLSAGVTGTFANGAAFSAAGFGAGAGQHFTDADGDGICDYRDDCTGGLGSACRHADADNDGVCDFCTEQYTGQRHAQEHAQTYDREYGYGYGQSHGHGAHGGYNR